MDTVALMQLQEMALGSWNKVNIDQCDLIKRTQSDKLVMKFNILLHAGVYRLFKYLVKCLLSS